MRFGGVVVALRESVGFVERFGARKILLGFELAGLGLFELTFVLIDGVLVVGLADGGDHSVFFYVVALLEIARLTVGAGALQNICDVATGFEGERKLRVRDDAGGIVDAFAAGIFLNLGDGDWSGPRGFGFWGSAPHPARRMLAPPVRHRERDAARSPTHGVLARRVHFVVFLPSLLSLAHRVQSVPIAFSKSARAFQKFASAC